MLSDFQVTYLNQEALQYQCLVKQANPDTSTSYITLLNPPLIDPSIELLWLLHFDEQLASAMSNVLNSPFSPYGILTNLQMELNVAFMSQFEDQLKKIKGQRVTRIGVEFMVKRVKLL